MEGPRKSRATAALVLFALGILLFAIAAIAYTSAPAELPLGASGWWDSVTAHHTAITLAIICGGLGLTAITGAVGLVGPAYRLGLDLRAEAAAAATRGVLEELGSRTVRLQQLRERGVIDEAEYRALRARSRTSPSGS